MLLKDLHLQNFRSYTKSSFDFSDGLTIVIGPNTAGKTNLTEAIIMLATGKSSRSEKESQSVRFEKELARIKGFAVAQPKGFDQEEQKTDLEIVLTNGQVAGVPAPLRRFLVNNIPKRRVDFASHISVVSFSPSDLDIVIGSPSLRRQFLDDVLEQSDREYRIATITYAKALRQRNALLDKARDTGVRDERNFAYWDELLIRYGSYIHEKRNEFLAYINASPKDVFPIHVTYDHSVISKERLEQYKHAEMGSAVTLVGPHRDDFFIDMPGTSLHPVNVKNFGSRGQQRLVILQLKLLQLLYMEEKNKERPLLLLDDIFSELDSEHIALVQSLLGKQQTIMTAIHKEFLDKNILKNASVIEL